VCRCLVVCKITHN